VNSVAPERLIDNFNLNAKLYLSQKRYDSALFFKTKSINLRDSIFNSGMNRTLSNIELKVAEAQANEKLALKDALITEKTKINNLLTVFIVVVLILILILFLQYRHQSKLSNDLFKRNLEVNSQKEELITQSEMLREANEEVHRINENLEDLVLERTRVIETQKLQILDYMMYNSHQVRAPLARILGLTELLGRNAVETNELMDVLQDIKKQAIELDGMVKLMNRKLEEEKQNTSNT
jgi:signal transduction histidine kinase